ncbi:hypothetical protein DYH09_02255 [bacterium CPR1]|nr:hypothetical protein [bacterium CPR1]
MKSTLVLMTLLVAASLTGCGNSPETQSSPTNSSSTPTTATTSSPAASSEVAAYAVGSKKKGDKGVCIVCNVREGTTEEEAVVELLDYKGKTYVFCNEAEKAEFISEPGKFVK